MRPLTRGEEKFLALHRWIANRLEEDPLLLHVIRRRLDWLRAKNPAGRSYRVAPASRWFAPAVLAAVFLPLTLASQSFRDPETVLAAMRQAMGANVDTVRAFSVSGSLMRNIGIRKSFSIDLKVLLPEHYLSVHRDLDGGGFRPIDITYFNGFAGATLIRRIDSNIPFPPNPGPNTPEAIARSQRAQLLRLRQEFARFCLILLGRSVDGYPLTFADGGTATLDGRPVDVVIAAAADGHTMRLHVDAASHLPVAITWEAPAPVTTTATMTSTVTTTNSGQVVSQSPPVTSAPAPPPPAPTSTVVWKVEVSDFKTDNGVNWARRFKVTVDDRENDEYRFGRYRINPKLEPKDFSIR